jgi:hypothetical protein
MIKLFLLSTMLLAPLISFANEKYQLTGKINGIRIEKNTCHISFETDDEPYYNNGWHLSDGDSVCKIAQLAYITGKTVIATAEVNTTFLYSNTIKSIIIGDQNIHFPPYRISD